MPSATRSSSVWGLMLFAGLAIGYLAGNIRQNQAQAERPALAESDPRGAGDAVVALSSPAAEGRQQITIIDPRTRVMSVYHVDTASGAITLKGVRNVRWDLQMEEFNSGQPTPREIRALLQQR